MQIIDETGVESHRDRDVEPAGAPEHREGLALHGYAHLPVRLTQRA